MFFCILVSSMKIISIILIVLFTLFHEEIKAQFSNFKWSKGIEKKEGRFDKIINFEEKSVVVFKPQNSSVRLDLVTEKHQSTQLVNFKGEYLNVFKVDNSIVIFSSIFNPSTKKDELHAKVVTPNKKKELLILEQPLFGMLHSKFKISVSPDFNHVFVLIEKPHKKGKKEAIVFTILDKELNIQRTSTYLMNALYSQKRRINIPVINNNGEAYVIKRYRESNKSKYYILGCNTTGNVNFKEFKLSYKPIRDAQYLLNSEGDLILGGTYSSPNSSRSEGTYITKFDIEGNIIFRKEYGFRHETMLTFTSERALKKEGLGLYSFRSNRLIQQKKNYILILEHRASKVNSKTGINTEIREGLIVYSFDTEGSFVWDTSLEMHQTDVSEKGYWNSFICFNDTANNNLSIIYNEVGYFDKHSDNDFGSHTAVGARKIILDNKGGYKKTAVKNCFEGASIDLVLSPKVNLQNENKMLILAEPLNKSIYLVGVWQ